MQLFLVAFQQPIPFAISTGVAALMIFIVLRSAMSAETRPRWVRAVTNVNAKFLFTFLFIGWAIFFGITLQLVPHVGASSPYGSIGLIALFTGFFIMMGLLWAVIGE
jgi:small neutral amino acid transporter SnatA (MarC family)